MLILSQRFIRAGAICLLCSAPALADEGANQAKKTDAAFETLAAPPPLPDAYRKATPNSSQPAVSEATESVGDSMSLLLRDGSRVSGTVVRADEEFIVLNTGIGALAIPRTKIQPIFLRLELRDGNILVGELLGENETTYTVDGAFGQMSVPRDQITGFEQAYFIEELAQIPGKVSGTPTGFRTAEPPKGGRRFSHSSIEPLIDIFFDPTGYTFRKGDIYISGLSLGYGFTDQVLATINVLELVGLNSNGSPNLRGTLKWNFLQRKSARREWMMAAVVSGDAWTRLGGSTATINDVTLTRPEAGAGDPSDVSDRDWQVESQGATVQTSRRSSNFLGEAEFDDEERGAYGLTSLDVDDRSYYCYSDTAPEEKTSITGRCFSDGSEPLYGSRLGLAFANSYSWLLNRGGRFGWHNGVRLSIDSLNYADWGADPTYRVYSAFDLDLNPRFKLLGEVFYDPHYQALLTDLEQIGIDFGMMYAFTQDFRVMVHLEAPFLGLFWRF